MEPCVSGRTRMRLRNLDRILPPEPALEPIERRERASTLHERFEAPVLDDTAVAQDDDHVRPPDCGQAVSDDESRSRRFEPLEPVHYEGLGLPIQRGGGLIEDQKRRI